MKKLIAYFLHGLLFAVPVLATIYIVLKAFSLVDSIIPFDSILPVHIPGLGLAVILGFITLSGYLGSLYLFSPILLFFERAMERAPLVKLIYGSVKDLVSAFVGEKKRFNQPVLVKTDNHSSVQRIGFITQNDLSELGIDKEKVAVYLPFSYSFSGELLIVPRENVSLIKSSGTDMMKFVISGGVSEVS